MQPEIPLPDALGDALVRATEAAALAAARHRGTGDLKAGDRAAVDAMRAALAAVPMAGVVVIGEGEKDAAPMLSSGERVGSGDGPALDIAVDPVEGTRLLALGRPGAVAVLAAAPRGSLWDPGPSLYMRKAVTSAAARHVLHPDAGAAETVHRVADALGRPPGEVTVFVLDKPRHRALVHEVRATGARVLLQPEGDVLGALRAAHPAAGVDLLLGTGGTPEGVLTAVAVRALGGGFVGRRDPQRADEEARLEATSGPWRDEALTAERLARAADGFFALTAITDAPAFGPLHLPGVAASTQGTATHSLLLSARTGALRSIGRMHWADAGRHGHL